MISFFVALGVLLMGYLLYGKLVDGVFGSDDRATPAIQQADGVDFVPMPRWKAFLIQLLNIAGTGPIFGALMGAVFGPVVFLWITFGSILGGAVHDYLTGMISERHKGASIAELAGIYLGRGAKYALRVFSVILLLLVGTVFVTSPASLLARLTPDNLGTTFWTVVILAYYVLATLLPIDKVIGKLYPVFGVTLLVMAFGIIAGLLAGGYRIPEVSLANMHPEGLPVWPYMFVTVACGAISGFHATQSPLISKCMTSEKQGKSVFYGAMIAEAVIALVWAAAGTAFYDGSGRLLQALTDFGQSAVVYEISSGVLGPVGGILAIVGVIACPITSGDTAFRSARLILAEWTGLRQDKLRNRLLLTLPLLALGAVLTQMDFKVLWRYFSWSNQTLAMIALWCASVYFIKKGKSFSFLLPGIPGAFMTAVSVTYILMAQEGFRLPSAVAYPIGIVAALAAFICCCMAARRAMTSKATGTMRKQG
ncbi:MAG: carbon starvation CstA family protein [Clostridiales bacterium]|nr:carbon starvation CstA family protein [Clostridiales bacterium]